MKPLLKKILRPLLAISLSLSGVAVIATAVVASKEQPVAAEAAGSVVSYDYSTATSYHNANNASSLKTTLENLVKSGTSGSYSALWTTYTSAYMKNSYIFDYYSNTSRFTTSNQDSGSGGTTEGDKYNREHTIPKSWWGGGTTSGTQGTDAFIVVPADKYINNKRSSNPLGMVGSSFTGSNNNFSKWGSADSSWGYSGTVFEPNDSVKGDLARIVFYACMRYDAYSWTTDEGSDVFSGSASTNFGLKPYAVKLFTYWNNLDKPDSWEQSVNDNVSKIQGNRNPFIDHPEYVNTLWGSVSGATQYSDGGSSSTNPSATISASPSTSVQVGSTITLTAALSNVTSASNITWTSSNSNATVTKGSTSTTQSVATVTASAAASNVTISCKNSGTAIGTISVSFTSGGSSGGSDDYATSIAAGDQVVLVSKDASMEMTSYSSTNTVYGIGTSYSSTPAASMVFTVEAGSSSGTYSFKNGSNYMYWNSGNSLQSDSSKVAKSSWNVSFDSSGNATITNASDSSRQILWNVSSPRFAAYSGQTIGTSYYNVQLYKVSGSSSSTDPSITVSPSSTSVAVGSTVNLSATLTNITNYSSVTWTTNDSTVATVSKKTAANGTSTATVTGVAAGSTTIYCMYGTSVYGSCTVTVTATTPALSSIAVKTAPTKTSYTAGEYFAPAGLVITCTYSNSSTSDVTYSTSNASSFTFSPSTSTALTTSHTSVTITYGGKSTSQTITVSAQSSGGDWVISSTPYRKALFGSSYNSDSIAGYSNSWTATNTDNATNTSFTVDVTNGNNNQNKWSYIKTGTETTVATSSYIDKPIGKVSLVMSVMTTANVTSITLYTSTSSSYTNASTYSFTKASGTQAITIASPVTNLYYKVVFVCTATKAVSLDEIDYYDATQDSSGPTLSSIAVTNPTTSLTVGDDFSFGGTVTATYSDSSTADVTSDASFSGYNMAVPGTYTVDVSYNGKSASYTLTVNAMPTGTSPYSNGYAYRMYFYSTNDSNNHYFTGSMGTGSQQYYGLGSTTYGDSVDVYFEANGIGQNIYFMNGTEKNYFYVSVSGTHYNFAYSTDTPTTAWLYNSENSCMVFPIDNIHYTFGNYGDKTNFSAYNLKTYTDNYKVQFALSGEGYAKIFYEAISCDSTGKNAPSFNSGYTWTSLGTLYNGLLDGAKSELQSATASESGSTYLEKATYRYDYIIAKYGVTNYANFMSRTVKTLPMSINFFSSLSSESSTAIIVIASLIGLTSAFGLLMLKKRKED